MLRRSFTATIEKNAVFTANFETEPYEAAWAGEARWFVRVVELAEGSRLVCRPQISPDGLYWCDEGSAGVELETPGLASFALRDFGGWLRLDCRLTGAAPSAKVVIHLALKE